MRATETFKKDVLPDNTTEVNIKANFRILEAFTFQQ
jgi:hypothetical protein